MGEGKIVLDICTDPTNVLDCILSGKQYDIIISDYLMPTLNGLDLLKIINENNIKIPFIIFTGQSREEVAIQALNLGAKHYIKKGGDSASMFSEVFHTIYEVVNLSRIEEALRISEERFRLAFHTSSDSININSLKDGVYIDVNEGFTKITGFSKADVIGKSSLSPDLDIWCNPRDRIKLKDELNTKGSCERLLAKFRMKDGRKLWGEMSATVITLNNEPHILSVTRIIEDVLRLQEIELKYKSLQESVDFCVFCMELDNYSPKTMIDANLAFLKLFQYTNLSELNGINAREIFVNTEQLNIFRDRIQINNEVKKMEIQLKSKGGNIILGLVTCIISETKTGKKLCTGIFKQSK
ncbi:MAG: Response regulator SaeR [Candidatus Heimdallarchaeota archaeon LC_3]|nr:MAG: Response regulator SaeR [Candidatus Heimdallarchaeota archaeon LC_3]